MILDTRPGSVSIAARVMKREALSSSYNLDIVQSFDPVTYRKR